MLTPLDTPDKPRSLVVVAITASEIKNKSSGTEQIRFHGRVEASLYGNLSGDVEFCRFTTEGAGFLKKGGRYLVLLEESDQFFNAYALCDFAELTAENHKLVLDSVLAALHAPRVFFTDQESATSLVAPDATWGGLFILGTDETMLTSIESQILIRGIYRIRSGDWPKPDTLKIVAVDQKTKREFVGFIGDATYSPLTPPALSKSLAPEILAAMSFSGVFATDLFAAARLPWTTATYDVHFQIGAVASNTVVCKVVFHPKFR